MAKTIDFFEAKAIQAVRAYACTLVSAYIHAKEFERDLQEQIRQWSYGEQSKRKLSYILARARVWLKHSDEFFDKLIDMADRLGQIRWRYRNGLDSKESLLRFTQKVERELQALREITAKALSGVIFEVEEFALKLMQDRTLIAKIMEKEELAMKLEEFRRRWEEEVEKEAEKILQTVEVRVV